MNFEDAANILDPRTSSNALNKIKYYGGFRGDRAVLEAVDDACNIAASLLRSGIENGLQSRIDELEAENAALRKMQPIRLDEEQANSMVLAVEVSDLQEKLNEAEIRCETMQKIIENYQDTIVPGYREQMDSAVSKRDAAIKELENVAAAVNDLSTFINEMIRPLVPDEIYASLRECVEYISIDIDWWKTKEVITGRTLI